MVVMNNPPKWQLEDAAVEAYIAANPEKIACENARRDVKVACDAYEAKKSANSAKSAGTPAKKGLFWGGRRTRRSKKSKRTRHNKKSKKVKY
jgi:hypothetical protein